jgi:hypothetical protein
MTLIPYLVISIIIFGLCVTIPIVSISYAAKITRKNRQVNARLPLFISVYLIAWLLTTNLFGYTSSLKLSSLVLLASIPLLIGVLAILFVKPVKALLSDMPLHWLIGLQVYRVLGFMFLYLYVYQDFLSQGFAMFAGIGDILVGLSALPVSWTVKYKIGNYKTAGIVWNVFGIADLIAAPAAAVIFGNKGLNLYPLLLVPLFIGPPFSMLLHVASLRNFYLHKTTSPSRSLKASFEF